MAALPPHPPSTTAAPPSGAEPARRPLAGLARIVFALVAAAALAALLWPRSAAERRSVAGGFLVDASGRPAPLARELKPVTLVHFWATWCAPCLTEIPSLLAYARETTDERLGLILVAVEDEPAAALRFLGANPYPLFFDPAWDVANRFGTTKIPETHLVVGGEVVDSFVGATDWSDPAVRARVARHAAARAAG